MSTGKRLQFANLKMAIEIVDLPISMVIFHSFLLRFTRGYVQYVFVILVLIC